MNFKILLMTLFCFAGCMKAPTLQSFLREQKFDLTYYLKTQELDTLTLKVRDKSRIIFFRSKSTDRKVTGKIFLNISAEHAQKIINENQTRINAVYRPQFTPYIPTATKKISCIKEYRLISESKVTESSRAFWNILFATENFAYGACSKESAKYRLTTSFIYCLNSRSLLELNYFGDVERKQDFPFSFDCL